jgi:hypothetical protein
MTEAFSSGTTPQTTDTLRMLEIKILNATVAGGGGTGTNDVRSANYGGAQPSWTPTGTLGVAVDTSTNQVWWYYGGAWH